MIQRAAYTCIRFARKYNEFTVNLLASNSSFVALFARSNAIKCSVALVVSFNDKLVPT